MAEHDTQISPDFCGIRQMESEQSDREIERTKHETSSQNRSNILPKFVKNIAKRSFGSPRASWGCSRRHFGSWAAQIRNTVAILGSLAAFWPPRGFSLGHNVFFVRCLVVSFVRSSVLKASGFHLPWFFFVVSRFISQPFFLYSWSVHH
jgi:hypothetical protein